MFCGPKFYALKTACGKELIKIGGLATTKLTFKQIKEVWLRRQPLIVEDQIQVFCSLTELQVKTVTKTLILDKKLKRRYTDQTRTDTEAI